MTTIIILALLGAVLAAVIGTLWYNPKTPMGRVHMKYLGMSMSPEQMNQMIASPKKMMQKMYALQFVLSFITAFAVVFIVRMSIHNGVTFSLALLFIVMNWFCFVMPTIGTGIIWGNGDRSVAWQKFFSDIFQNLLMLIVAGVIAGLVP